MEGRCGDGENEGVRRELRVFQTRNQHVDAGLERLSEVGGERGIRLDGEERIRAEPEHSACRLTRTGPDLQNARIRPEAASFTKTS